MLSDHEIVLQQIVRIFDRLGISYFVGGSVASSSEALSAPSAENA